LLTEREEIVCIWRTQLTEVLGKSGRVLTQVLPELEQIIGVQPFVPELPPEATQNRFRLLLKQFIQAFITGDRPLVVFLDDLQWADAASLYLIQDLLAEPIAHKLLLIGAYREEAEDQNFLPFLNEIRQSIHLQSLHLLPLTIDDLALLISDTFRCSPERVQRLAKLVHQKTQGNPFFSSQLLKSFYQDGLIYHSSGGWECDISQIR
jgi:predicted ATPase